MSNNFPLITFLTWLSQSSLFLSTINVLRHSFFPKAVQKPSTSSYLLRLSSQSVLKGMQNSHFGLHLRSNGCPENFRTKSCVPKLKVTLLLKPLRCLKWSAQEVTMKHGVDKAPTFYNGFFKKTLCISFYLLISAGGAKGRGGRNRATPAVLSGVPSLSYQRHHFVPISLSVLEKTTFIINGHPPS